MVMLDRLDDVLDTGTAVWRSDLDFTEMERVVFPLSFAGAGAPPRQITAVVGAGDMVAVGSLCSPVLVRSVFGGKILDSSFYYIGDISRVF